MPSNPICMPYRLHLAIGALFAILLGSLFYWVTHTRRGELFDKPGWSVLQGLDDPPPSASSSVLVRNGEFAVLGFRGVGETSSRVYGVRPRWSWVLLNEHHADGAIKQMPIFRSYALPCSELKRVKQEVPDADDYAMKYLRSICTEK